MRRFIARRRPASRRKVRAFSEVLYLMFSEAGASSTYAADEAAAGLLDPNKRMQFTLVEVPTSRGTDYTAVVEMLANISDEDDRVAIIADVSA